jgi:proton-dependent oligopeptide transporter, POT family
MDFSFLTPVVLCILITETVERFAYYGFRAVLVLYFINSLKFSEQSSIALYAYVLCLAYTSPLLGAYLADGFLGRYMTILCFGWIYALGLAILTCAAFTDEKNLDFQRMLSFIGLFLFCIGTGGIKPCVSAFGADQVAAIDDKSFDQENSGSPRSSPADRVRAFFASFYFCINLGAVSSICILPIVKHNLGFGAAFLIPALFVVIAMLTFASKSKDYVHQSQSQDGSSIGTTFAISFWIGRQELSRNRWINRNFPCIIPKRFPIGSIENQEEALTTNQNVMDARQALRVLPILLMFPVFWMLYDQHSSVWTLQAARMELHGLQPEQLVVVNPVEIMILIPVFDRIVYPCLENCGWKVTHIGRMRFGMLMTATSFSLSGILESWIESSDPNSVSVFWQLPQITILTIAEILVSITGLEFAYSMSPERLKAFIMAIYLVMTAIGNFFGGILYSSVFQQLNRATVMHVCAFLMLVNSALFCWVGKCWEKKKDESPDELIEMNPSRSIRDALKEPPRYVD